MKETYIVHCCLEKRNDCHVSLDDVVRYESSYATEPVYERNGQVYDAPQRAYQDPYGQEAPSSAQSHQY